ncbi:MAG: aglZ, partial [Myxococcaceae bacterium]|nr:aglZ [Myxococcaceae bacterium]
MERRVLIVEGQNDFALTMASVLHDAGYTTSLAANAADASRELEKRRPDLVILRAELPDQSGFVLCGTIRKGKFGANLPVILLSSDVAPEALQQHSTSANAAHGYLPIPFEMGELTRLTLHIMPPGAPETATVPEMPAAESPLGDDEDLALDAALTGKVLVKPDAPAPAGPPPIQRAASGPPRLPKRERRSALNDEDRTFLDRAFASIADRKAELLAESKEVRRTTGARRDLMGTPEGKIQLLRDELKIREAQIARISEIWSVRERELLSVEDRVNEKDVEIQGTKMQLDDLTRRLNDAQATMVEKERDHGRQIEDLLLQKFIGEKEVIEVVSAKEKDINVLRREISHKDEELARRASDFEAQLKEYSALEKDFGTATIESEVREKNLAEAKAARDLEILALKSDLEATRTELSGTISARDTRYADFEGQLHGLNQTLDQTRSERENTVSRLQEEVREAVDHHTRSDAEIDRLRAEASDHSARNAEKVGELEGEITSVKGTLEALQLEKQELETDLNDKLQERAGRIEHLEKELSDTVERKDRQEAELQAQVQEKLERIGELEGEVEATKAALADREEELNAELGEVGAAKEQAETDLAAANARGEELTRTLEARQTTIDGLNADLADREAKLTDLGDELGKSQKSLAERDAELSAAREDIANKKGEIEALTSTVEDREANIEKLTLSFDQSQKELASTQDTLTDTREALAAKTGEQEQTATALAQTQVELEKVRAERTEREGEGKAARNEVARVTGLFRASEAAKSELEERLSGEIGQLKTALSEATGNYEAEAAAHADLQKETSEEIAALTGARDGLAEQLESTQVNLAATQANLTDRDARLNKELADHASTRQALESEVLKLTSELNASRDQGLDLNEQLAAIKQELGQRVAEVTQLSATLAHAQDAKGHLEERIGTLTEEAQRREELLQNDLATKSKELADTLRKLTALSQEKTRQADALTRDAHAKGEAVKQLESKLKALFDDSKKKLDELQG